jgi:hypothetical protein
MEPTFPITRENLRDYKNIHNEKIKDCYFKDLVDSHSYELLESARTGKTYHTFIVQQLFANANGGGYRYKKSSILPLHNEGYTLLRQEYNNDTSKIIEKLIEALKERFPDCNFTQDPGKLQLFVDWS